MSPEPDGGYIATSITGTLLPRMARTHRGRRIGVFAGPPGIGKSTAINRFALELEGAVATVTVPPGPRGGLKATAALQLALDAVYSQTFSREFIPANYVELRSCIFGGVCEWAGLDTRAARQGRYRYNDYGPLSVIFDEAQNLSREAIEVLRFLNDERGGYAPFPLGLVFIGNNEFVLKSDGRGQSVLSAAVADRALYAETLSYSDVTDDDLALFLEARGLVDEAALRLVIGYFGTGRSDRSFRRVSDLHAELAEEAGDGPITREIVSLVLGLS